MSIARPAKLIDLGRAPYWPVYREQLAAVARRQRGEGQDILYVVEHSHVITVGRSAKASANILAPGHVEVVSVERGGDVTYHGPGQLVAYPILALGAGERDLHRYLRNLEEAIIRTCRHFDVVASREPGRTGVWARGRKLASIGIACRKWVTFHGLALNVTTDLSYFRRINPCGFDAAIMTSLAEASGRDDLCLDAVKAVLVPHLAAVLHRAFVAAIPACA